MKIKYVGNLAVKVQEGQKIQYGDVIKVSEKLGMSLLKTGNFEIELDVKKEEIKIDTPQPVKKIRHK